MQPLNEQSASEAARRLASREISAEQMARACLARIEEREGAIKAWIHLDADAVIAAARLLDAGPVRGPLHGLPLGVKDLIDTADMPTAYGSPIYAGHRPRVDAACVALARAAGALVLGKTVTTEFAWFHPGNTANPRNIADETLSAKVVVHQQCWKCHPVGTGKEASAVCEKCHSGKKTF